MTKPHPKSNRIVIASLILLILIILLGAATTRVQTAVKETRFLTADTNNLPTINHVTTRSFPNISRERLIELIRLWRLKRWSAMHSDTPAQGFDFSAFTRPQNSPRPITTPSSNSTTIPTPTPRATPIQTPTPTQVATLTPTTVPTSTPTPNNNAPVAQGRQMPYTSTVANREYLLYLPSNYQNPPEGGWPVIMFFHGAGIGDSGGVGAIRAEYFPSMLGSMSNFPFVVISPRMYTPDFPAGGGSGWLIDSSVASMMTLLDEIQANYQVNSRRTYLTGYSLGGATSWRLAMAHPTRFAAVAPVAGFYETHMSLTVPSNICDLAGTPVRAYHGTADTMISIALGRGIVNALKNCSGSTAEIVEGPWSHSSISGAVYSGSELYDWFLSHARP